MDSTSNTYTSRRRNSFKYSEQALIEPVQLRIELNRSNLATIIIIDLLSQVSQFDSLQSTLLQDRSRVLFSKKKNEKEKE